MFFFIITVYLTIKEMTTNLIEKIKSIISFIIISSAIYLFEIKINILF